MLHMCPEKQRKRERERKEGRKEGRKERRKEGRVGGGIINNPVDFRGSFALKEFYLLHTN